MALTLPKTWGVEALTHTDLNDNFKAIVNKVNGQLDSTNLAATGAGVTNSQLANSNYEIVLTKHIDGIQLNRQITNFFLVGSLPYDSVGGTTSTYTILGIDAMTIVLTAPAPATSPVYTLVYGTAAQITLGTAITIRAGITPGVATAGQQIGGLAASTVTISNANVNYFALDITTEGVGFVDATAAADGDCFCISIKLKRTLGLRA